MIRHITMTCIIYAGLSNFAHAQLTPVSRLSEYVHQYYADKQSLERKYMMIASPGYYDRMEKLYDRWLNKMMEVDYSSLSVDEGVDFILLRRNMRRDSLEEQEAKALFKEITSIIPFRTTIEDIRKKRVIGTDLDGKTLGKQLTDISQSVLDTKASLKKGDRLSEEKSHYSVEYVKNLQETLKESYHFYDGYDPDVTWWAEKPFKRVDSTLTDYISFLKDWKVTEANQDDGSGIVWHPIGDKKLGQLLDYEMIPYSPQELIDLANKEYDWCLTQMLQASHDLGYGNDWKTALEHVKNTYVAPGKQPELIYGLAQEAISFLKEKDLITIPSIAEEDWGMRMMSPDRQLVNPFFTGGINITISYPTNTMTQEDKMMSMRGNNPYFSRATVHHELIAGHHLQFYYQARYNTYRRPFNTPFWIEGWSLYWELHLWDLDFAKTPEQKIGMLFWRMHRCARIIFSLNYHLGKWSAQQCIDFLVDKVGHEYANAEAEVRRSFATDYPPLYQAAYLLGGLQIKAMHNELVNDGSMSEKDFNDSFLKNGSMPIEMMRYLLMDKKPPKDFKTHWRFYEKL